MTSRGSSDCLSTTGLQFANAGVPPDLVGAFVGNSSVASIGIDGSFIYQDSGSDGGTAYTGRYLSYE